MTSSTSRVRRVTGRPRFWLGLNLTLVVLIIAGLAIAGTYGWQWYQERQVSQARDEAVAAARQTVVNFMSISAGSVDRDMQRVLDGSTGDFHNEFGRGMQQVKTTVVENKVTSRAKVLYAGYVTGDSDSATVLVAMDATVRNARSPDGRLSHYRIQVDMARDKQEHWLVSRLVFVG